MDNRTRHRLQSHCKGLKDVLSYLPSRQVCVLVLITIAALGFLYPFNAFFDKYQCGQLNLNTEK